VWAWTAPTYVDREAWRCVSRSRARLQSTADAVGVAGCEHGGEGAGRGAQHYEQVKGDPDGDTHLNIRNFMKNGWEGITFAANGALVAKERLDDPTSTDGI